MIIVVGAGNSGTRVIGRTLKESGVWTGRLNLSYDTIPAVDMFNAAKLVGRITKMISYGEWNFSKLVQQEPSPTFKSLVVSYLSEILNSDKKEIGFKLPQTILTYPWIVKQFSNAKYIHWVRDPRDVVTKLNRNNLKKFAVDMPASEGTKEESTEELRSLGCKYQWDITKVITPENYILVRFEDFVLNQDQELKRLRKFLGIDLKKIEVQPEKAYRWSGKNYSDILNPIIGELGYARRVISYL